MLELVQLRIRLVKPPPPCLESIWSLQHTSNTAPYLGHRAGTLAVRLVEIDHFLNEITVVIETDIWHYPAADWSALDWR